jgi:hypothetical protein
MVNLFPEATPENGQSAGFLNRAPGLRLLTTVGTGPIRGLWTNQNNAVNQAYIVSGNEVYKMLSDYSTTLLGSISGTGPVSIADNGYQVAFVSNPNMYIYNETTNAYSQVTDPDFAGAATVSYIDGYFVFNQPDTQILWVTEVLDGTVIDPLAFAAAESTPDNVLAVMTNNRETWVFGSTTIEVWYNAATVPFPLAPIQGAYNEIGCAATYSIAKLDNGLFWLGADSRGFGIVYRNNGYTAVRISTHAVEYAIQGYPVINDAIAYTYQQEGHAFYVLTFPTANATWVYDVATGSWHERGAYVRGEFKRHRSNCQMSFNQEIIVGDYENSNIYAFDLDVYADNGDVQKWLRSWRALPTNANNLNRTAQHTLQLNAETGVGINNGQGSDPQVMLRWSDDGGHTWSSEHWTSMGKIGTYGTRAFWRRLGMTTKLRDRVYEVSGTDPVKISIIGAELILSGSSS